MAVELGFIVSFTSSKIRKDVSPDTFEESYFSWKFIWLPQKNVMKIIQTNKTLKEWWQTNKLE